MTVAAVPTFLPLDSFVAMVVVVVVVVMVDVVDEPEPGGSGAAVESLPTCFPRAVVEVEVVILVIMLLVLVHAHTNFLVSHSVFVKKEVHSLHSAS